MSTKSIGPILAVGLVLLSLLLFFNRQALVDKSPSSLSDGTTAESPQAHLPTTLPSNNNLNDLPPTLGEYSNSSLGFRIFVPPEWRTPTSLDFDPHFDVCKMNQCSPVLEIEKDDNTSGGNPYKAFSYDNKLNLSPKIFYDLIPGAVVIRSLPNIPAEGWVVEYEIFWTKDSSPLVAFSTTFDIEKSVLPTLAVYP